MSEKKEVLCQSMKIKEFVVKQEVRPQNNHIYTNKRKRLHSYFVVILSSQIKALLELFLGDYHANQFL